MAFNLFDEDEKNKITESFNSLGIPTQTVQTTDFMSYDSKNDDRKKLDDEIIAKNKALEDIISNQRMEENQIKDDYDSLSSRANRFLQVFGAGLRGDNASQVAQSLSDRLDKRLQGAQARYKDQRDSAYSQYKDLLARREALNKSDYDRQRDQAKDKQWEQEFGLKTKTQADQNAIQKAQLDILRGQNATKEAEAKKVAEAESQKVLKDKVNTDLEISQLFSNGTMNPTGGVFGGDNDLKGGKLDDVVIKLVQKRYGIAPKDYPAFKKANPDMVQLELFENAHHGLCYILDPDRYINISN
jgi:ElaB/YqjD/DUF883 family membrane-anchored ribosome-binding protein